MHAVPSICIPSLTTLWQLLTLKCISSKTSGETKTRPSPNPSLTIVANTPFRQPAQAQVLLLNPGALSKALPLNLIGTTHAVSTSHTSTPPPPPLPPPTPCASCRASACVHTTSGGTGMSSDTTRQLLPAKCMRADQPGEEQS